MRKKLIFIVVAVMMAALLLAGCGGGGSGEQAGGDQDVYKLKIGSPLADTHPGHDAFVKFKELVEEKSDGRFQVEIFANQVLGGDRELIEAVQMGTVDMMLTSTSPVANFDKNYYLFDLPFLFPDRETAYAVLDGEVGQALLDSVASQGIKGLGYWENGFRHITNNVKPIESISDLKGLKIRTMENQLHLSAWKTLGANPTPMAFGELFTGLQQGTVDGQENPLALIDSNKFYEVQDYLTMSGHIYTPFVVFMNLDYYNNLPEDLQQIVMEAMQESSEYQRDLMVKEETKSLEVIKAGNTEVNELSEDVKAEMVELLKPVYDEGAELMGSRELIDKLMAEVESLTN
ncbi:TRAP transporter substrate-binding protein [Desulfofalx alkaliphila]|uniref:TRAP transporter substrate-binding protein n=1 Tax=Desulfofalx alkaliphila TaxID=105483 RepID=UPI0004E1C9C7|nr:TRAP transporter substrate-binding protein [Desulfofalx alkaliphila]